MAPVFRRASSFLSRKQNKDFASELTLLLFPLMESKALLMLCCSGTLGERFGSPLGVKAKTSLLSALRRL